MSILIPIYSKGVTLTEVPDKLAVYFEIGNCKQNCKGCHSPMLQFRNNECYLTYLKDMKRYAEDEIEKGANAIVLMGGTTNEGVSFNDLKTIINTLSEIAPVCLYSGSDDERLHRELLYKTTLTWLKTGSYDEEKGGLDQRSTNQRFYKIEEQFVYEHGFVSYAEPYLVDMTHKFRKGTK